MDDEPSFSDVVEARANTGVHGPCEHCGKPSCDLSSPEHPQCFNCYERTVIAFDRLQRQRARRKDDQPVAPAHATNGDVADPTVALGALADGFRATDVGNAERLVAITDGHIRFVHAWAKWIVYTDGRWLIDPADALVTETAKQVARRLFWEALNLEPGRRDELWKWAKQCEKTGTIRAMLHLARGVPGVLTDHANLDVDPWVLNVLNGTVDLRTGDLR